MLAKLRAKGGKNRGNKDENRLSKLRMSISGPTGFKHADHMGPNPTADVSKALPPALMPLSSSGLTNHPAGGARHAAPPATGNGGAVAVQPERPQLTRQQKQSLRESISGPMTLANMPVPAPRVGLATIEQVTVADLVDLPPPSIGDLAESQAAEAVVAIAAAKQAAVAADALLVQGYLSIANTTDAGPEWDQHWFKLVKNWRCVVGYSDPSCSVVTSSIPLEGFIHARFGQEIDGREDEHTLAVQTAKGTRLVLCPSIHKANSWLQAVTTVGLIVQELPSIARPSHLPPPPPPCLESVPMLEDSFAEDEPIPNRLLTNLTSAGCGPLTTFPEEADDGEEDELDEFEALCISQGLLTER